MCFNLAASRASSPPLARLHPRTHSHHIRHLLHNPRVGYMLKCFVANHNNYVNWCSGVAARWVHLYIFYNNLPSKIAMCSLCNVHTQLVCVVMESLAVTFWWAPSQTLLFPPSQHKTTQSKSPKEAHEVHVRNSTELCLNTHTFGS